MSKDISASVPDQALAVPAEPANGLGPSGFDPSRDVLAYLRRALPHVEAGLSPEAAMRAVLDDDVRLFTAMLKRGSSAFSPTPDERGVSRFGGTMAGDVIASELSARVYTALRQAA